MDLDGLRRWPTAFMTSVMSALARTVAPCGSPLNSLSLVRRAGREGTVRSDTGGDAESGKPRFGAGPER